MVKFFVEDKVGFEAWKLACVPFSSEHWNPLFWSAKYGLLSLAEMLMDNGFKTTSTTPDGFTVLHIASQAPNRLETLRYFLICGGDPNYETSEIIPAFHTWLSIGANAECVELMMRNGASCSLVNQKWKWNALHYFGLYGEDEKVLSLLLDDPLDEGQCSNIGVKDDVGETAFHKLMSRQDIPQGLVEAFLKRGADVNAEDNDLERPLHEAAYWGEDFAIKLIIDKVTEVDCQSISGFTALHLAAWSGRKSTVELLIDHNADANLKDKSGRTPLFLACLRGAYGNVDERDYRGTAEYLVQEQIKRNSTLAQINATAKGGRTPLSEAAARGFIEVVAAILGQMSPESKELINHRDKRRGRTALHVASAHGRPEVVALLLQQGADAGLREGVEGGGMTNLELSLDRWAVINLKRYETTICHLIDVCMEEAKDNKLLLTTAATQGSMLVLKKLVKTGVNLGLPDAYGWPLNQLASQFGHAEAASFIMDSIAEKAMRPTKWTTHSKVKSTTTLDDNGVRVSHMEEGKVCVASDHPVPANVSMYYYEIEILDVESGEPRGKSISSTGSYTIIVLMLECRKIHGRCLKAADSSHRFLHVISGPAN